MAGIIRSLEKRMAELKTVADRAHMNGESCVESIIDHLREDMDKVRRKRPEPPPEGGISINAASRKFNIGTSTICGWITKGILTVLRKNHYRTYVSEAQIAEIAEVFHESPGAGKRDVIKKFRK